MMAMFKPRLDLRLAQRQKMVPKMMVASELMVMNLVQLEEKLARLAEENPFLDSQEDMICYGCGAAISGYPEFCPACGRLIYVKEKKEFPVEELSLMETRRSWKEILREEVEVFVDLTPGEKEIFHVLLASLDASGFLGVDVARIAFSLQRSEEEVWKVIEKVREAGFLGFASRDALEFLLLQAQKLGLLKNKDMAILRREVMKEPDAFRELLAPHLQELFMSPAQFFEASLGREREEIQREEETVVPDA
jgi:DNA-directed RNA polymerase specialized sigma54-like protein